MAKITTVIDIGSNSMRMVVLEKSSRYAFHLINETKARVKISEGTYENQGNLQEIPMDRAFNALKSFLNISKSLKSRKILCVATSAMRDAPNSNVFIKRVQKELGLNIRVIHGEKEAFYGGVAAKNLIYKENFMTIDIGGGSTEFAIVKNAKIDYCISLNIGTVRLNELFFSKGDIEGAKRYILEKIEDLRKCGHDIPKTIVGIGGTIRSLSKVILNKNSYPLDVLHSYTYKVNDNNSILNDVIACNTKEELKSIGIKKDRFDTIKEGTLIFNTILEEFGIEEVITSGVGVREGVYLADLLRTNNCKFPQNYNVSVRSLLDRFQQCPKQTASLGQNAGKLFEVLKPLHNLDSRYKPLLVIASKLNSIGANLNFYKSNDKSADFVLSALHYDFLHTSRVTTAHIIKFARKSLPKKKDLEEYAALLPDLNTMQWLCFMMSLNLVLHHDHARVNIEYKLKENKLKLQYQEISDLVEKELEKLHLPDGLKKVKIKK